MDDALALDRLALGQAQRQAGPPEVSHYGVAWSLGISSDGRVGGLSTSYISPHLELCTDLSVFAKLQNCKLAVVATTACFQLPVTVRVTSRVSRIGKAHNTLPPIGNAILVWLIGSLLTWARRR